MRHLSSLAAFVLCSSALAQGPVDWIEKPVLGISLDTSQEHVLLTYDRARECLVALVEGRRETWERFEHGWELRPGRMTGNGAFDSVMAYDSDTRRSLLVDAAGTWAWDGETWSQLTGSQSLGVRWASSMAYDSRRQRLVLHGGYESISIVGGTWEFDGLSWTQVQTTNTPGPRYNHAMAYDEQRGRVVLFGGMNGSFQMSTDTWEYDGTNWTLRAPSHVPPARWPRGMTYDASRGVTVLLTESAGVWEWDGADWNAVPASQAGPSPFGSRRAFAFDEQRGESVVIESIGNTVRTWSWNGTRWLELDRRSWLAVGRPALGTDPVRKRVVAFGGEICGQFNCGPTDQTWEWNGSEWRERSVTTVPPARSGATMFYDDVRQLTVMFGGEGYPNPTGIKGLNDLWAWDGVDWTQLPSLNAPPLRVNIACAWDRSRGRAVLFGGGTEVQQGPRIRIDPEADTWEWDGASWTQLQPATQPPARSVHGMAYDEQRGRLVMFGGNGLQGLLNDTWEWDGVDWHATSPSTLPPTRSIVEMAYDPSRGRVVLYSGSFNGPQDDLWDWDGTNWNQIPVAHPLPFVWASAMAYDPNSHALLVATPIPRLIGDLVRSSSQTSGVGCTGSPNGPSLRTNEATLGRNGFRFEIVEQRAGVTSLLFLSKTPGNTPVTSPLGSCTLYLGALDVSISFTTNALGVGLVEIPIPADPILRGVEVHAQALINYPAASFLLTNAQRVVVGDGY